MSGPATAACGRSNRARGSTASRRTSTCAADLRDLAGEGRVPVLVCWESAAEIEAGQSWCHRHIVAQWLERGLGIEVAEVGYEGRPLDRWACLRAQGVEPPMP